MTGESIPGVECMGKVVALGSTIYSCGKWPTPTLTATPLPGLYPSPASRVLYPRCETYHGVLPFSHAD